MKTSLIPITLDTLPKLAEGAKKFGMPRSIAWFRRCLFDPTVEDWTNDGIRGHLSVDENGEVIAEQAYYYVPGYFKQRKILIGTRCFKGADRRYGEELLCVLDKNRETASPVEFSFVNAIANIRSAKVNKAFGMKNEPPCGSSTYRVGVADIAAYPILLFRKLTRKRHAIVERFLWLALRPIQWGLHMLHKLVRNKCLCVVVRYRAIDMDKFSVFWECFLKANTGVISSRDPRRLSWLFDDSLKAGTVSLSTIEEEGRIKGYVMLRKQIDKCWSEVIDICAERNDVSYLRQLANVALDMAADDGRPLVIFHGYMGNQDLWLKPVFTYEGKMDHPIFLYNMPVGEVGKSLLENAGWFFGPYDGDYCLGHGGYIDK